ncbi:hypothetical protein CP533_2840 [Ophiocordyceps camponoti-saundersi (nom. inval.)]|nr:hypothetical protein CP533_2840 [Ophiocordyceps camponoti-saundersi (nom. inval.)]
MSRQKLAMTAAAVGAGALGISLYNRRSSPNPETSKDERPSRHSAHAKREFGLEGAALGGNAIVGSTELGAKRGQQPSRSPAPLEKLPSGGIGGGEGAGGSSARKTQFPYSGSGQSYGGEKPNVPSVSSQEPGALEALRGVFGPGDKPGVNPVDEGGFRDTRGASKMGSELPSKKRAPPA